MGSSIVTEMTWRADVIAFLTYATMGYYNYNTANQMVQRLVGIINDNLYNEKTKQQAYDLLVQSDVMSAKQLRAVKEHIVYG